MEEDKKKELNEISELVLELGDLLKQYEMPKQVCDNIAMIMQHVSILIFQVCEDNKRKHTECIEYAKALIELNYFNDELMKENEDLRKFIEAIKDFPGFQC